MNRIALANYFEEVAATPSNLGGLDCVRFVIESIYYGWGADFRDVLGYSDRRSAVERLRIAGGLEQSFTDEFGEPVAAVNLRPGDIAYFEDPAIGLVMPGYVAVKFSRTIGRVSLQFVSKGWQWVRS